MIITTVIFFIAFLAVGAMTYGIFDNGKRATKENWQIIAVGSAFLALICAGYIESQ
jgi:hypothetical protein